MPLQVQIVQNKDKYLGIRYTSRLPPLAWRMWVHDGIVYICHAHSSAIESTRRDKVMTCPVNTSLVKCTFKTVTKPAADPGEGNNDLELCA